MDKANGEWEFGETREQEQCLASIQDLCLPFALASTSEEVLALSSWKLLFGWRAVIRTVGVSEPSVTLSSDLSQKWRNTSEEHLCPDHSHA